MPLGGALADHLGEPLQLSPEAAAEGVLEVACAQMADLIRRVTIQRGYDPREFVLYAFGGAAPQYAGRYALELGVGEVVVPVLSAVFSAFGAIAGELRTSAVLDAPRPFPFPPAGSGAVSPSWRHRHAGSWRARRR